MTKAKYTKKCNKCGAEGLGWKQRKNGKWYLCEVFLDLQYGEVLGAAHKCQDYEKAKAQVVEREQRAASRQRNMEEIQLGLAYITAYNSGDLAETERLGKEIARLMGVQEEDE